MDTLILLHTLFNMLWRDEIKLIIHKTASKNLILELELDYTDAIRVFEPLNKLAVNKIAIPANYRKFYEDYIALEPKDKNKIEVLEAYTQMLKTGNTIPICNDEDAVEDEAYRLEVEEGRRGLSSGDGADIERYNANSYVMDLERNLGASIKHPKTCKSVKNCCTCGACFGAYVRMYSEMSTWTLKHTIEISWGTPPFWLYEKVKGEEEETEVTLQTLLRWCEIAYGIPFLT